MNPILKPFFGSSPVKFTSEAPRNGDAFGQGIRGSASSHDAVLGSHTASTEWDSKAIGCQDGKEKLTLGKVVPDSSDRIAGSPKQLNRPTLQEPASFSLEDALNPQDAVVLKAVQIAVEKGEFAPLLEAGQKDKVSVARKRAIAAAIRALTKREEDKINRARLAAVDGVEFLISLLHSSDNDTVEHAITALLNLSLTDCARGFVFVLPGGINSIVEVIKTGSPTSRGNGAALLYSLADKPERKLVIGEADVMVPLIHLLLTGSLRGKKDAALALFSLSQHSTCRREMLKAGVMKAFVTLLNTPETGVEEKVVAIITNLAKDKEGRDAILAEDLIHILVDVLDGGSSRAKEDAASALLIMTQKSEEALTAVRKDPPNLALKALLVRGSARAKEKASALMGMLKLSMNAPERFVPVRLSERPASISSERHASLRVPDRPTENVLDHISTI